MMADYTLYTAPLPAPPFQVRDIIYAALAAGVPRPDILFDDGATLTLGWSIDPQLSAAAVTALRTLVASNPQPATAPWRVQEAIQTQAGAAMAALQTIIDKAQYAVANVATAQTAIRDLQGDVKAMARMQRRLIRLVTGDLAGSD